MTKKQIKWLVQNVLDAMKDETKWQRTWESTGPINFKSGREYSWINKILLKGCIWKYGYQENVWLTANQSNDLWLKFKKGIKRIPVVYYWKTTIEVEDNNGEEIEEEKWFSKIYKVANINHFKWVVKDKRKKNKEKVDLKDDSSNLELLQKYLKRESIKTIVGMPAYLVKKDQVRIPSKNKFSKLKDYEKVLTHECIHSTGSENRLDRDLSGSFGSKEYGIEELVAEFGSCILSGTGKNGFNYISNRAELIEKDKLENKLIYVIKRAQKAIDYLKEG